MEEDIKQSIEIAEIKKDVKYIIDKLEDQCNMISTNKVNIEVLINSNSERIGKAEEKLSGLEPVKKLYEKMAMASLGIMITLGMAVIGLAYTLLEKAK